MSWVWSALPASGHGRVWCSDRCRARVTYNAARADRRRQVRDEQLRDQLVQWAVYQRSEEEWLAMLGLGDQT